MAGQIIVQRGAGSTGGGGGTPGGSNTQVQYNDGGAFGGDAGLTYDEATDILTAVGGVDIDSDAGLLRLGTSQDVILARDAANTLAQRNGTNSQELRLYKTFTNASNYERFASFSDASRWQLGYQAAGTGSARELVIFTSQGDVYIATDKDHGSGANLYTGRLRLPTGSPTIVVSGHENEINLGAAVVLYWGGDTVLSRTAASVLALRDSTAGTNGATLEWKEQTAPSAGAANTCRVYAEDNGSGKTRLMARFNTGAAQQIAIEP